MQGNWTRRDVLRRGGTAAAGAAGLAVAGVVGYAWPRPAAAGPRRAAARPSASHPAASPAAAAPDGDTDYFVTRSDLRPPVVTITPGASAAGDGRPAYIFIAPRGYLGPSVGKSGLMIVDREGRLVWFGEPKGGTPLNFRQQRYHGQPVLTWSAGFVDKVGVTFGTSYIADSSYRVIATVKAGRGAVTDLHDFQLTPHGTALITAHRKVPADLSALGGPAKGVVWGSVAQEVDVATGKVLFEWDSSEHVPLSESQAKLAGGTAKMPYDYFHINSIDLAPDGDLLISSRNTWTIYKVARQGGAIRWRLGGKKSDFELGPGAKFEWQHDARMPRPGLITLFDNASSPPEEKGSRALVLRVDTKAMRVSLARAYSHPDGLLADNQGNTQLLPDGRVFVGWGAQPYFSEFGADGKLLLNGQLPVGDQSYRAFTFDWAGRPPGRPALVVRPNPARGSIAYVSWNGATEVKTWTVLAGRSPGTLAAAGSQPWAGFETKVPVNSDGPYFAVTAHDASGRRLGRSATVRHAQA